MMVRLRFYWTRMRDPASQTSRVACYRAPADSLGGLLDVIGEGLSTQVTKPFFVLVTE